MLGIFWRVCDDMSFFAGGFKGINITFQFFFFEKKVGFLYSFFLSDVFNFLWITCIARFVFHLGWLFYYHRG